MHRLLIAISCLAAFAVADSKSGEETPKYWRAILGDICQLPSFPRATGDPHRYVECVRQSSYAADRKDLGIWLLRECLPGYEFVASARRCKTIRSVKRQQELCESNNATMYQFCPTQTATEFLVEEIREAPRQCACPNGEDNCVCPSPEILEPVNVPVNSEKARRSPTSTSQPLQFSQYQSCPCPPTQPQCTCVATNGNNERSLMSVNCCPQPSQQSNPCQCQVPPDVNCQTTTTQQQYCPQQQPAIVQPQACPLVQGSGVQNAQYQGICSWMVDPLAVDPQSRTHYLQCQPAPNNLFCGRWQRMPCAPGTVFDVQAQVCVWDTSASPASLPPATAAPMPQAPQAPCSCVGGVQIGSCNQNYQCPGQSVCQVGQNAGQQVWSGTSQSAANEQ
ncbi:hypothetical protein ANCDUO_03807 [Ancylostoma duodenale]|uniref:Chitin-binding type-2 domain-containing protein n=1 Tax=Ancylostoma duodenale TaxID=51022 RepID=A0A0C2H8M9_9BILA|nr:hypothetical protein ANCDUO_03807 [Ancylostoma duodenale]